MLDDGTKMVSVSSGGQGSVSTESTHTLDVGSDRTRTWGWARTLFLKDESEIARTGAEASASMTLSWTTHKRTS